MRWSLVVAAQLWRSTLPFKWRLSELSQEIDDRARSAC
jgi:hypothetical protein